jgi:hypothetical protein
MNTTLLTRPPRAGLGALRGDDLLDDLGRSTGCG